MDWVIGGYLWLFGRSPAKTRRLQENPPPVEFPDEFSDSDSDSDLLEPAELNESMAGSVKITGEI